MGNGAFYTNRVIVLEWLREERLIICLPREDYLVEIINFFNLKIAFFLHIQCRLV